MVDNGIDERVERLETRVAELEKKSETKRGRLARDGGVASVAAAVAVLAETILELLR